MLLSDAERERLFERLSEHAAAGSLGLEELERRVERVARAETREDAVAALADLPAAPGPPRGERRGRRRAHGEVDAPEPDWQPTAEVFRDPRTGRVMRVWADGRGGRHYLPESDR